MRYKSVCFFLPTGRTFTFRDCIMRVDNETVIVLEYIAMSDRQWKTVTFYKAHVAGVATCPTDPEVDTNIVQERKP